MARKAALLVSSDLLKGCLTITRPLVSTNPSSSRSLNHDFTQGRSSQASSSKPYLAAEIPKQRRSAKTAPDSSLPLRASTALRAPGLFASKIIRGMRAWLGVMWANQVVRWKLTSVMEGWGMENATNARAGGRVAQKCCTSGFCRY